MRDGKLSEKRNSTLSELPDSELSMTFQENAFERTCGESRALSE
jgi:hypothetical protein